MGKALMTNLQGFKSANMLAAITLLLAPGFQTTITALATLRVPSFKKMESLQKTE